VQSTHADQAFPSRGPKTNSARSGGPYLYIINTWVPFAVYDVVKTWEFMEV